MPPSLRGPRGRRVRPGTGRRRNLRRALGLLALATGAVAVVLAVSAGYHAARLVQALRGDDLAAAEHQLAGLRADVRMARWTAMPLRPIGAVPVLGRPVADLTHGLDAARHGVDAAAQGLALYRIAGGGQLLHDGRVDLDLLARLPEHTTPLRADLEASRNDLAQVRGGWLPGLSGGRDEALTELDRAITATQVSDAVLRELPTALGADGPRTYVVATLNSGELLPSGGALLAVALLRVDDGRIDVVSRGQVSQLTNLNQEIAWDPLPGDPWQTGKDRQRLANANYSPDFPTSGEEILRLYQAQIGEKASGVIALDASAFSAIVAVTGPLQDPTYGELTSDNVVRKTMVDAYLQFDREATARHAANDKLIDTIFAALLQSKPGADGVTAVVDAMRAGHIQMYFRDAGLQTVLDRAGATRSLAPFSGDALGVYTINTNASKVDVFQERTVTQDVVLAADGSAQVTRTVVLRNDPHRPCPTGADAPTSGYMSCLSRPRVVLYLPEDATQVTVAANEGAPDPRQSAAREKGRQVVDVRYDVPAGQTLTVVLRYRLPAAADSPGYAVHWDGQPMVNTPTLTVRVTPAPGTRLTGTGWRREGDTLVATVPLVGSGDLRAIPGGP
ncbi:MAG: DUF4012 domain-containing protein [Kineosporiaceae bacterium]